MINKNALTGWERSNRKHFDEIVENYDKARWDYPDELFEDIITLCGSNRNNKTKALEIGAGTGKATEPFLKAGYTVTAVEMGVNMTEFLSGKFKENKNFNVITSAFEQTELTEQSYDLIYAASSFHWVDAAIGCPKVLNLLKSGGLFALFRNNAVPPDDTELHEDVQAVYEKHYYSHYKKADRPVPISKMTYEDFLKPDEIKRGFGFECLEQYGFYDIAMKLYRESRTYGADEYISLLETYSDHRALPDKSRAALYAGIKEVINKHKGSIKLNFIFQLYTGRKGQMSSV